MKRQADKANYAQIKLHILRQRKLGARMIGDDDEPTWVELIATASIVITAGVIMAGWWLS